MGRADANPAPENVQAPETIEDAPPHLEISNDDQNVQENYDNYDPTKVGQGESSLNYQENQPQPQQQSQQPMAFPPQNWQQHGSQPQQQSQQPMAFPPQNWQQGASQPAQFPPQHHQMMSNPNPNNVPQTYPSQPQGFPPRSPAQPLAFPPSPYNQQQQQQKQQDFPHQSQLQQNGKQQAFPPNNQFHQNQGFQQQAAFQNPNNQFHQNQGFQQQAAFQNPNNAQQHYSAAANFSQHQQPGSIGGQQAMGNYNSTTGFPLVNQNPAFLAPTQGWRTGLFDCMNDPGNAIVTACFPCVTFGQIAEVVDSGSTSCTTSGLIYGLIAGFIGVPCLVSCTYRSKMRARFGLIETPAQDWLVHCLCEWCALCQEYRELQLRGLDPSIVVGWLGNVAKSQQMQMAPMTPPHNQTMMA